MKSFNPLYILLALLVGIIYFFINNLQIQKELQKEKSELIIATKKAKKIHRLSLEFANPKLKKRELLKILNYPIIKSSIKEKSIKNSKAYIKLEANNKGAKYFVEKISDKNFKIKTLKIKKIDDFKLFVETEIIF